MPTLVTHGDDDRIVPYKDAALLSAKLLKHATLKIYPGFPHGMLTTLGTARTAPPLMTLLRHPDQPVGVCMGCTARGQMSECYRDRSALYRMIVILTGRKFPDRCRALRLGVAARRALATGSEVAYYRVLGLGERSCLRANAAHELNARSLAHSPSSSDQ